MFNPARSLARIFIDVFGITHPSEKEEKRVVIFINVLLVLIVLIMAATLAVFLHYGR